MSVGNGHGGHDPGGGDGPPGGFEDGASLLPNNDSNQVMSVDSDEEGEKRDVVEELEMPGDVHAPAPAAASSSMNRTFASVVAGQQKQGSVMPAILREWMSDVDSFEAECRTFVAAHVNRGAETEAEVAERIANKPFDTWSTTEKEQLKGEEWLSFLKKSAQAARESEAASSLFKLRVTEDTPGTVATAVGDKQHKMIDIFARAAAGGKLKAALARECIFHQELASRGKASALLTYAAGCAKEVREVYEQAAVAPVVVRLAAGNDGTFITLRVTRLDAKPRLTFEVDAGLALPVEVMAATEEKLLPAAQKRSVYRVTRSANRGLSRVTLFTTEIPPLLRTEPWLLLEGQRCLVRFPGLLPTCDRCWASGHMRNMGCPLAAAEKAATCTSCKATGHSAERCRMKSTVCRLCNVAGHIMRHCPQAVCFNCNHNGHISIDCKEPQKRKRDGGQQRAGAAAADEAAEEGAARGAPEARREAAAGAAIEVEGGDEEEEKGERMEGEVCAGESVTSAEREQRKTRASEEKAIEETFALCDKEKLDAMLLRINTVLIPPLEFKRKGWLNEGKIVLDPRGAAAKTPEAIAARVEEAQRFHRLLYCIARGYTDAQVLAALDIKKGAGEDRAPSRVAPAAAAANAPAAARSGGKGGKAAKTGKGSAAKPDAAPAAPPPSAEAKEFEKWMKRGRDPPAAPGADGGNAAEAGAHQPAAAGGSASSQQVQEVMEVDN